MAVVDPLPELASVYWRPRASDHRSSAAAGCGR